MIETQSIIELNAVTSEYDNYNYSLWNILQFLYENGNPEHGFSQTVTGHIGNNMTLGNLRKEKLAYHLKNYLNTIFRSEN